MSIVRLKDACIKGVCAALPDNKVSIDTMKERFKEENIDKVASAVGVQTLYHAKPGQTASDFCFAAAERLLDKLGWERSSIDGLLFISQTPDYITPATSCILQHRLGLPVDCIALDINLGCSGYIYGLFMAYQFIATNACRRVLVLVGDTISKSVSEYDKGTALIFSDGGTATAVETAEGDGDATFNLKCDGSGSDHLIVKQGGYRFPDTFKEVPSGISDDNGAVRADKLYMNGMEIFSFAVREVPKILKETVKAQGWDMSELDHALLHQANRHMLQFIARNAGLQSDKVPINIDRFGNTSGATIPLLICDLLKDSLNNRDLKVVMSGFGVGLSWGACALTLKQDLFCSGIFYI